MKTSPLCFSKCILPELKRGPRNIIVYVSIVKLNSTQIVKVTATAMQEFAENILPYHIEYCKVGTAVTCVLEKKQVNACLFMNIHKVPGLIDGDACRYFQSGIYAGFHCFDSHP